MLKLFVIGHLGKDAVVNNVNGRNVINFSVAHTEKYKDANNTPIEKTTWVECSYWTDKITIAPYLKKGTQIFGEGTPEVRSYTTNDGRVGASLILRIQKIELMGGAKHEASEVGSQTASGYAGSNAVAHPVSASTAPAYVPTAADITEPSDDLPF
jgi:single-strand DNA-binding protein